MTDNKLTDEQIIKAVDILEKMDFFGGQRAGRELWFDKPADVQNEDIKKFSNDVAFLKEFINRQKAEKEALINGQETLQKHIAEIKAEVERLYAEGLQINKTFMDFVNKCKAEAIKEFAERLKKKAFAMLDNNGSFKIVDVDDIDNLLKEMEGE